MRVEEPRKTAEVILAEDKGWSSDKVADLYSGSNTVTLDKPVPVYLVYFTARVDDNGRLVTYGDIYGNDGRVMSALRGHPVRYTAPEAIHPDIGGDDQPEAVSDAGFDDLQDVPVAKKKPREKQADSSDGEASFAHIQRYRHGCARGPVPELTPIDLRNKIKGGPGSARPFNFFEFRCALCCFFERLVSICRARRGRSFWRGV